MLVTALPELPEPLKKQKKRPQVAHQHRISCGSACLTQVRPLPFWGAPHTVVKPRASSPPFFLAVHNTPLCIVVGAVTVTPAENFVSPLSESSPSPRVSIKKKKKKVSVATRQSVHPSERSPTLPSSSGLCVRQIENKQQSTVGEVSQPLKVMALASRLAGPDNAVPSLPSSDNWLSKKKQKKKSGACSCTSWCSQATF